jgi:hypothetical protein
VKHIKKNKQKNRINLFLLSIFLLYFWVNLPIHKKGVNMKTINLSLVAIATLSMVSLASADNLSEALSNGKVTGDVSVTYESRNQDKEIGTYYKDTEYSVGSIGLNYKTADFNNFGANIGVRAYKTLFEDDSNKLTGTGYGDASERFYETGKNKTIDLETAYITYDLENLHIKAGRQFISTEWINKTQDAVSVNASLNDTDLELIWTNRQGRVSARDYRPMTEVNKGNGGLYKLALTQNFNDSLYVKAYALTAPSLKDIYGGKVNYKNSIDGVDFGAMAHYAATKEDVVGVDDSNIMEFTTFATIAGIRATLGYVQVDEDAAFNHIAGETIIPFEEGDQMYLKDARTTYIMLSKNIADISLTALYGITKYEKYEKSEFNLWAGYELAKNLSLNVGYAMTDEDKKDLSMTDLQQLNATIAYIF